MRLENNFRKPLFLLMLISVIFRSVLAAFTEPGNDEIYYRLYALFPAMSHFDHPPMVGWVIQFFSLNLLCDHVFFLRLGALFFGTLNLWLVYLAGKEARDARTGFYAALLFTASPYFLIISGIFIMPDAPQVTFWLMTLILLMRSLPDREQTAESRRDLLFAGITTGLALLSKYHSVFLLTGAGLYLILFNRRWFRTKELYIAFLTAILMFLPVIIWNVDNSFISFAYHGERVEQTGGIQWKYMAVEVFGQILYQNPLNFVLILMAILAMIRKNDFIKKDNAALLLLISVPLTLVFLIFSVDNATLPHWTGPAYAGYTIIAAAWLSGLHEKGRIIKNVPVSVIASVSLMIVATIIAFFQINTGFIPVNRSIDPTTDLYGYRQLGEKFEVLAKESEDAGLIGKGAPVMTERWFPAANFDYFIPGHTVYAIGTPERIHEYLWINKKRGLPEKGINAWYIGLTDGLNNPNPLFEPIFDSITLAGTIPIMRGNREIRKAYVFRMKGLKDSRFLINDSD